MKKFKLFVMTILISLPAFTPLAVFAQVNPLESSCEQISNSSSLERTSFLEIEASFLLLRMC